MDELILSALRLPDEGVHRRTQTDAHLVPSPGAHPAPEKIPAGSPQVCAAELGRSDSNQRRRKNKKAFKSSELIRAVEFVDCDNGRTGPNLKEQG